MPYKDPVARQARHVWRLENEPGFRERWNAAQLRRWHLKHAVDPEPHREQVRRWRRDNLDQTREMNRASATKQRAEHPEKTNAHARKAQTARMKRYPAWADDTKIQEVYALARLLSETTGVVHHVDHVIPLQGRRVSGLHVHNNLQAIPAAANQRKFNHFEVN